VDRWSGWVAVKQFESEKWRAVREIEPLFDFVFFLRKNADLRRKTPMALS